MDVSRRERKPQESIEVRPCMHKVKRRDSIPLNVAQYFPINCKTFLANNPPRVPESDLRAKGELFKRDPLEFPQPFRSNLWRDWLARGIPVSSPGRSRTFSTPSRGYL